MSFLLSILIIYNSSLNINVISLTLLLPFGQRLMDSLMSQMFHEKQISYLYEVGIQGGIRRAADILGINASVISRQIALLERTLQLPLLERRGRTVVLTEAGKLLADDFFESRIRREKLERHLKDLRYMKGGAVTIRVGAGLVDTLSGTVWKVLRRFIPIVLLELL